MDKLETIKNTVESITLIDEIETPTRKIEYILARAIYFKLSREFTNLSFPKIGRYINKDHATVIHGIKKHEYYYQFDDFKENYNKCFKVCEEYFYNDSENVIDDILDIEILKKKVKKYREQSNYFKKKYTALLQDIKVSQDILSLTEELTPIQVNTFKERMAVYVKICKDQNKRNKLHVDKYEHNNKSHSQKLETLR